MPSDRYSFLVETYRTESLKTLSVWSQISDARMDFRPEPRARTPREHMVHQCVSEHGWMTSMLGLEVGMAAMPLRETRLDFIRHYAAASDARLRRFQDQPDEWFEAKTSFFDAERSRAWVLVRRFTHSAHHRGQLTAYLRSWGDALYSTYGPTADTGGLPKSGARVVYRYESLHDLLARAGTDAGPALPGPGIACPTERGEDS